MDLKILEIASNTENHKVVKNHTHLSKNKNPICGDEMEISLLVKNDVIEDIGYQCKSYKKLSSQQSKKTLTGLLFLLTKADTLSTSSLWLTYLPRVAVRI